MFRFQKHRNPWVSFLICGTQKGGTTALDAYLRMHPDICMAKEKEVHFFDNEEVFAGKHLDYSAYHAFFDPKPHHRVIGEATPIYMYWNSSPRRIWEYNPSMKIIVILRNPIERAFSHWNMEHSRNTEHLPFREAIRNEAERCREALPLQHRYYSYIDRGFYVNQLRRLWAFFSKERVLILRNEDLRKSPARVLSEVSAFLGIAPPSLAENLDMHSIPYTSKMTPEERSFLRFSFEYEIRELERILGWDCSEWMAGA